MKEYIVAINTAFESEIKIFRIKSENVIDAYVEALMQYCETEEDKKFQKDWLDNYVDKSSIESIQEACLNNETNISHLEL